MFAAVKTMTEDIRNRTIYMEIFNDRKISYRVIAGRILKFGKDTAIYGVEAKDSRTGESEAIENFSPDIEDAVAFAEMLTAEKARPKQIYSRALVYLMLSI